MKYEIKEAYPSITMIERPGRFMYAVSHWNVKVLTWDGICHCTDKMHTLKLDFMGLDLSREEILAAVKEKIPNP